MKMRARVRVTQEIGFEHDVPALAYEPHSRARTGKPGQIARNESEVLAARAEAARAAERAARAQYPDAAEILVEEVTEVNAR